MKRKVQPKIQKFVYESSEPVYSKALSPTKENKGILWETLLTIMKISGGVYLFLFTLIILANALRIIS